MRINKWLDLLDRAGWTAVEVAAGSFLVALTTDAVDWQHALATTAVATGVAVCKVVIAQNAVGQDGLGDAIPGAEVIEEPSA
jgi:hypothetical protein